jgi:hypothetical protein
MHDWENSMSTAALPEDATPALSEAQRLLYTFTAPSRTMADLRRNASWWVPWLLISVASIAFVYALDKRVGWGQVMETQIQANPKSAEKMDKMAPEQREKIMKIQETSARVMGYLSPVTALIALVVVAGVLLGLFNFGFGTKLSFKELMGVTAYGFLPSILSTLLTIVVLFFVEPGAFDLKYPVATSLGYFVPGTMPFVKTLLGAFDVFTLWQIFLLAVGIAQLSRLKVKTGTAFATIFSMVFLFKLGAAALGSM